LKKERPLLMMMMNARAAAPTELEQDKEEWQERIVQIRRVTKVVKGGKKMSFRAVVIVGNGSGMVGMGVGKADEVVGAIRKAVAEAKKSLVQVALFKTTIPHPIEAVSGASKVVLRPASEGTGVIAGGAVRIVLELAGIKNVLSKAIGSRSSLNVARAAIKALGELRTFESIAQARGITVRQLVGLA
jgi:small subunit ribosomal protein S5